MIANTNQITVKNAGNNNIHAQVLFPSRSAAAEAIGKRGRRMASPFKDGEPFI